MTVDTFPYGIALFFALGVIALALQLRQRAKGEASDVQPVMWAVVFLFALLALAFWETSH